MSSIYSFKGRPIIDAQKYIEFRWGLTIVSFLPPEVYEVVKFLQKEIGGIKV